MAQWITQRLELPNGVWVALLSNGVCIDDSKQLSGDSIYFEPTTRNEANMFAISLRLAAKRLEELGKGME